MSNKTDFLDWKTNPITKKVFETFQEREANVKDLLALEAGINSLQDRYYAGYLAALRDLYLISFEEVVE